MYFFKKKFSVFEKWAKLFALSLRKFPTGLSNQHSFYVSRGSICGKKVFLCEKFHVFCLSLLDIEQKFFRFWQKFFTRICASPAYMSTKIFLWNGIWKKNFSNNFWLWSHYFGFLTQFFDSVVKFVFFLLVQGTLRGKQFFWKKIFFPTSFGHWANFFAFLSNIFKRVVKTEFSVYGRAFWLEIFFLKKFMFSIFLGHWVKLFEAFAK